MITEYGIKNLKKYCREPIENIKGYREATENDGKYDCHHINELTFTRNELIKMNMYYHRPASELIIMPHSEHTRLHRMHNMPSALYGERNGMYGRTGDKCPSYGRTGNKNPMYGRTGNKNPMYGRTGDKSPMYGKVREKHPNWKGDKAEPPAIYRRALKLYKSGQISEKELQVFRDARREYDKMRNSK